jgi:MYXO-CTERM domain-containing protein
MTPMRFCVALLCASLLLVARPSYANGRFPLSQRLFQDQGNTDHLYLSATFGLLVSRDRGQNWYHVCESALTPELLESDILFEVMPDGAMLAALVRPLSISSDCGCTWQPVLGLGKTDWVKDIARAGQNSVVALTSDGIARSTDGGRNWSDVTPIAVTGGFQTFTLDAAPSDPMRLYVSITLNADPDAGVAQTTPALLVSDDGGESWSTRSMTDALSGDQPFIAAVHPTNPDIVYVRTDNWSANDETGLDDANDGLFVTDDAGMTFREVLRKGAKLFGFALSPDTDTVLAGFGDPAQATRNVYPEELGIYRASTSDHVFTHALANNTAVSCLTWNASGLYACFDELVGLSADGSVPPMSSGFTQVLAWADVRGPLACNGAVCLADWQEGREDVAAVCERLDAECNVDPAENVITCSAPMGGAGGMGAAGTGASAGAATGGGAAGGSSPTVGMGGTTTSTAGALTGGATATGGAQGGDDADIKSSSSCGCRAPRAIGNQGAAVMLALLALFGLRRRHRSRARRFG